MEAVTAETIEGCIAILKDVDEQNHDARLCAVIAALTRCVELLNDANETE